MRAVSWWKAGLLLAVVACGEEAGLVSEPLETPTADLDGEVPVLDPSRPLPGGEDDTDTDDTEAAEAEAS